MESSELTLQIPHGPVLTLMRGRKSTTLKRQIPLDLHLQSLPCQEKGSVNVLSKMTLTFRKRFYPGHARSPKFSLGAAPWPRGCSACPGLLLGLTWDYTGVKNTQWFVSDRESGHLFPKVFSSHWAKQNVFQGWFSALHWVHWGNKLRTEKNLKPRPIWKPTTKFLAESSKEKGKNSQCWVHTTARKYWTRTQKWIFISNSTPSKETKKLFSLTPHHVIASNSFGGAFWRGQRIPLLLPKNSFFADNKIANLYSI